MFSIAVKFIKLKVTGTQIRGWAVTGRNVVPSALPLLINQVYFMLMYSKYKGHDKWNSRCCWAKGYGYTTWQLIGSSKSVFTLALFFPNYCWH